MDRFLNKNRGDKMTRAVFCLDAGPYATPGHRDSSYALTAYLCARIRFDGSFDVSRGTESREPAKIYFTHAESSAKEWCEKQAKNLGGNWSYTPITCELREVCELNNTLWKRL